jgi:hypothetical protein
VQLRSADYQAAWETLARAAKVDATSTRVQQAQEDVAMQWLENIHANGDQTFASITGKLEPVLTSGVASAKLPQRQADLLAHLGFSYFLRSREVPSSPDPERAYREALRIDPANPYAHAMWGHWILWNHGDTAKASEQFAAALAAPRPSLRPYIRTMQLSAFNNVDELDAHLEIIRVANEIRKEHGDLDPYWPHHILNLYWEYMAEPNKDEPAFMNAVPPLDHLDTFDWLLEQKGPRENPDSISEGYIHDALLEAAGRRDEALAGYRALESRLGPHSYNNLAGPIHKGVVRLTPR